MQVLGLIISVFPLLVGCYFISKEIKEVIFLKKTLNQIIDKPRIESIEDFVQIKNYLQKNISYNPELKHKKRPILRHTASEILISKYGFCGENARVAIKLMLLGGIKANRIYLFRKEWEHVLIEHKFNSNWFMFDGHLDTYTNLKDSDVLKIPSNQISLYPDSYPNNPYLGFSRIKLFYKLYSLKSFSKIRLHSYIIYLFESPFLIKAILLSIPSLLFLIIILL